MLKPPTPADEFKRLETLRSLKLLDTPPEERFDRVTRLAKRIFGVPIALVSLVDGDRQWFKSRQGLEATETPREISFCGHAIVGDRIFVINDAAGDERFCDNPLVTCDPNIRFYAGYPLNAPNGSKVGTLCVIDRKPRELSNEDLQMLRELGRMVEEELVAANMATNDPCTGLSNRLGFSLIADHLLGACRRAEMAASLLLFQLTNLDEIDASFGADERDRAMVELAHLLMASFRDSDIIGRVATDCLGVLLAGTNLDGMDRARDRLENLISEQNRSQEIKYQLEVRTDATVYHPGRHSDTEALIQDIESRRDAGPQSSAAANAD
jgi:diguanylate cyclase (GGDEF)-like protein